MAKVNPNNENETKSDIFSMDIFKSDITFHWAHNTKIFQFIIDIFQFHRKSEPKQVKRNEI